MTDDVGVIGFKAEINDLERAAASLENLATKGVKVDQSVGIVERAAKRAGRTPDDLGESGAQSAAKISEISDGAKKASVSIESVSNAALRSSQSMKAYSCLILWSLLRPRQALIGAGAFAAAYDAFLISRFHAFFDMTSDVMFDFCGFVTRTVHTRCPFVPVRCCPHAVALCFARHDQLVAGLAPSGMRPCWAQ
jgi:hypothetical protein